MRSARSESTLSLLRVAEPDGLDAVFDGIGQYYFHRGFSLLRRGGKWVQYANPLSRSALFLWLARFILFSILPNGKSLKVYGTGFVEFNKRPFPEDCAELFNLLEQRKIEPIIMK